MYGQCIDFKETLVFPIAMQQAKTGISVVNDYSNTCFKSENDCAIFLTPPLVVKTQKVDNFNCTFSEWLGKTWSATAQFQMIYCSGGMETVRNSNPRDEGNVVTEVVATNSSGGFTSSI